MVNLLAALAAAQRGSRELDCQIYCLVEDAEFIRVATSQDRFHGYEDREPSPQGTFGDVGAGRFLVRFSEAYALQGSGYHRYQVASGFPAYTTSLDAALTLVPDLGGCDAMFFRMPPGGRAKVTVWVNGQRGYAEAPTVPLAICLAILYERRRMTGDLCKAGLWDIQPEATCPVCGALPDTECGRVNPARERRHPPGCTDPDWCVLNGCWWDCQTND